MNNNTVNFKAIKASKIKENVISESGTPKCHIVNCYFSNVELYSIVKHCYPISKAHTHDIQASHTTVMMTY